ncbi:MULTISPECIES: TIGR03086 family metal-binding protein [unclassified Saccharothrix]|uniref:TIGR03086 family metal-binding protein n=1 Tax=unclassified Saccharothrix TaxID=2593673 RepID=UPI00307F67D6
MNSPVVPTARSGRASLVDALCYALSCLDHARTVPLDSPTPCTAWDLEALLRHVDDSLTALHEGITTGHVDIVPRARTEPVPASELLAAVGSRARRLLAACLSPRVDPVVDVADRRLPTGVLTAVGTVEVAVHGWDVARACGHDRPLPDALAATVLELLPLVAGTGRFAPPVPVPASAPPGDRVLALLGRDPA